MGICPGYSGYRQCPIRSENNGATTRAPQRAGWNGLNEPRRALALVIEDVPAMQALLRDVLAGAHPELEVSVVDSVRAARRWLHALAADEQGDRLKLALVDMGLPDGSGAELFAQITDVAPDAMRIVATIYDDDEHLFEAFAAGAQGYLLKDEERASLVTRLRNIARGEPAVSPSLAHRILGHFSRQSKVLAEEAPGIKLTARETETLQMLSRGLRVAETATLLGVSHHTVSSHIKAIYAKLGISSRAEATLEAVRRGLV